MPDNLMSSPFLYNLSLPLIHFIWQGFFVALALKLALSLTSYKKPQWRYAFSSLAMVANLLLPLITFFIIYQPDFQQFSPLLNNGIFLNDAINNETQNTATWYANIVEFFPYLSLTWVTISFALAVKLFIELYNVNQLPKIGTAPATAILEDRFHRLVKQVGLKCTPRILISLKNDVPMAIGWLKPVVLIPVSMLSGLTPAQLDMLILHELAHIRRHDYLVNFLQTLVEIFLFFHPAVRWVSKQMRNEREYCSDDIAVQHCGNSVAYAHTLADTASLCAKHRHHSIPAMAMAASGGDLKQRVIRLIDKNHHCSTNNDSGKWLASVAIIFIIVAVTSKNYIQLPALDISSGTLSLYRSTGDSFTNKNRNNNEKTLPSLALQLLHQDDKNLLLQLSNKKTAQNIKLATPQNTTTIASLPKSAGAVKSNLTEVGTDKSISPKDSNKIETVSSRESEQIQTPAVKIAKLPSTSLSREITQNNKIIYLTETQKNNDESFSESTLGDRVFKKKSISELAFERTDSMNNDSALSNPYAQQVATLASEPVPLNSPLSVSTNLNLMSNSTTSIVNSTDDKVNDSASKIEKILLTSNNLESQFKAVHSSAQLLSSTSPKYPSSAKRKAIEADIQVTFTIDKSGYIRDIQYYGKGKINYFRNSIRSALQKWRFTPANYDGQAIESTMTKIFSFSLEK
jgi:TonB family protein